MISNLGGMTPEVRTNKSPSLLMMTSFHSPQSKNHYINSNKPLREKSLQRFFRHLKSRLLRSINFKSRALPMINFKIKRRCRPLETQTRLRDFLQRKDLDSARTTYRNTINRSSMITNLRCTSQRSSRFRLSAVPSPYQSPSV